MSRLVDLVVQLFWPRCSHQLSGICAVGHVQLLRIGGNEYKGRDWEWIASPVFMSVALVLNQNVTISEEAASQLAASKQASKQPIKRSIDQSINPYQYNVLSRLDEALPPCTSSLPERVAEWCGQPWQRRSQAPTRVKSMCRKSSYQFLVVRLVQTSSQFGFVTWRPLQTEKLAIRTSTSGATTGCNRPTDCVKTFLSFFDAADCYCYCLKNLPTLWRIEQQKHCLARKLVMFQ